MIRKEKKICLYYEILSYHLLHCFTIVFKRFVDKLDYFAFRLAFVIDTIQDFMMSVERNTSKLKWNRFYDGLDYTILSRCSLHCSTVFKLDYFAIRLVFRNRYIY